MRPCTCDRTPPPGRPYSREFCKLCWLFHNDERYHRLWGGPTPPPKGPRPLRGCIHQGDATGETRTCGTCRGKVELKLFACRKHGVCTPSKPLPDMACCLTCQDKQPPIIRQIEVTLGGIGDAVLGLATAQGLQDRYPDDVVAYFVKPWQRQWVELFGGYDILTENPVPEAQTLKPHDTWRKQDSQRLIEPRWEYYSKSCGVRSRLPEVKPLPKESVTWAEPYKGCVVLSPWAHSKNRTWSLSHWQVLERHLIHLGHSVVVIAGQNLARHDFFSEVLVDESASRIAALFSTAGCVISCDSGMAHVAGMLGVPTVALCGRTRGEHIFGIYPSVRVIQGPLPCTACHEHTRDFQLQCRVSCAALQEITPKAVLEEMDFLALTWEKLLSTLQAPVPEVIGRNFADRRHTFQKALFPLTKHSWPLLIAETGTMRAYPDPGAGTSTLLFGLFLKGRGRLISFDNDTNHVKFAGGITRHLPVDVRQCQGHSGLATLTSETVDLLYLDSTDTSEPNHAEVCLQEAQVGLPKLRSSGLVLIDDTIPDESGHWKGKGRLAVPFLLSQGWEIVASDYQVLLQRRST